MNDIKEKTLADAQAGDKVLLYPTRYDLPSVEIVKRTTNTLVVISGASEGTERMFYKSNGAERGRSDAWSIPRIKIATAVLLAETLSEQKRKLINNFRFRIAKSDTPAIHETYEWLLAKGFISEITQL